MFVFMNCVWPNYGSMMTLVARLDYIFFFHPLLPPVSYIYHYDGQTVVLQVKYERTCGNPNWKLDLFWALKWMTLLMKKIPQKYSSYGHAT
jgi:hypothetical protein